MANISKNIKKLRTEARITQQELADHLNVTRQAVSSWENGKNQPDIQTLELLATEFDVSLEEIIYGTKIQRNQKKLTTRLLLLVILCVVSFLIVIPLTSEINHWVMTHYVVWPSFVVACVLHPICFLLAGSAFISVVTYFTNIHVKEKKLRKWLTILGIVFVLVSPIVYMLFWISIGIIMTQVVVALLQVINYIQYILYVLGGVLIYLGVAKEPSTE